jgi:hypothetical protein
MVTITTLKCMLFNFMVSPNCNIEVDKSKVALNHHFNVWVKYTTDFFAQLRFSMLPVEINNNNNNNNASSWNYYYYYYYYY